MRRRTARAWTGSTLRGSSCSDKWTTACIVTRRIRWRGGAVDGVLERRVEATGGAAVDGAFGSTTKVSLRWCSGLGKTTTTCYETRGTRWSRRRRVLLPGTTAGGEWSGGDGRRPSGVDSRVDAAAQKFERGHGKMREDEGKRGEQEIVTGAHRVGRKWRKWRRPCGTTTRKLGDLGHESERAFGGNRWRSSRAFRRNKRCFNRCSK